MKEFIQSRWKKILAALAVSVILAVLLEFLQVRTQPAEYLETDAGRVTVPGGMLKSRMAVLAGLIFAASLALSALGAGKGFAAWLQHVRKSFGLNRRETGKNLLFFVVTAGVSWLGLRLLLPEILEKPFNFALNFFSILASAAAGCLVCFRKALGKKPEAFFLALCLLIGSVPAFLYPAGGGVSWDDADHYSSAFRYSYLGYTRYTEQDELSMSSLAGTEYPVSGWESLHAEQNDRYNRGMTWVRGKLPEIHYSWMFIHGAGLYLGRVLKLPYWLIWSLGRFFGLLAYAVIGYFAIRRLKSGKMILTLVLLIPENVFLASNYSCDPGVTACIALGMSFLAREWQEPDKKLNWRNAFIMIGAMTVGCLGKAIYFPVLLLPLFLRKEKFAGRRQQRQFYGLTLAAIAALVLSFLLPFVLSDGEGDLRGGTDVNAFGQAGFILSHPLEYTGILLRFLGEYLSPDRAGEFLTRFGFMGMAPNHGITLILLAVAAFTDRDGEDLCVPGGPWGRTGMLGILFMTTVLFATSMYVSFTPVGLETVNGCQPRYLLPLFFPAMLLIGSGRVRNGMNRAVYNGILFAGIGFAGFSAVLMNCVHFYV